jgi:acetate kinase
MEYAELDRYLNTKSGLLGIGGSSDIRELIEREKKR